MRKYLLFHWNHLLPCIKFLINDTHKVFEFIIGIPNTLSGHINRRFSSQIVLIQVLMCKFHCMKNIFGIITVFLLIQTIILIMALEELWVLANAQRLIISTNHFKLFKCCNWLMFALLIWCHIICHSDNIARRRSLRFLAYWSKSKVTVRRLLLFSPLLFFKLKLFNLYYWIFIRNCWIIQIFKEIGVFHYVLIGHWYFQTANRIFII